VSLSKKFGERLGKRFGEMLSGWVRGRSDSLVKGKMGGQV
jgi:hypothetical protein